MSCENRVSVDLSGCPCRFYFMFDWSISLQWVDMALTDRVVVKNKAEFCPNSGYPQGKYLTLIRLTL